MASVSASNEDSKADRVIYSDASLCAQTMDIEWTSQSRCELPPCLKTHG
jgi:hypothetical protein